jgi:hypothetical protein
MISNGTSAPIMPRTTAGASTARQSMPGGTW